MSSRPGARLSRRTRRELKALVLGSMWLLFASAVAGVLMLILWPVISSQLVR
jgi:hypothetical protein